MQNILLESSLGNLGFLNVSRCASTSAKISSWLRTSRWRTLRFRTVFLHIDCGMFNTCFPETLTRFAGALQLSSLSVTRHHHDPLRPQLQATILPMLPDGAPLEAISIGMGLFKLIMRPLCIQLYPYEQRSGWGHRRAGPGLEQRTATRGSGGWGGRRHGAPLCWVSC